MWKGPLLEEEEPEVEEAEVVEDVSDNLVDQVKAAGTMRDLKIICKDLDEFKSIRGQLTKYKTMKELREVLLGMLEEVDAKPVKKEKVEKKKEETPEPAPKVEKKPVEKKVEKKPIIEKVVTTKLTMNRSQAIAQAVNTLCKHGATMQEIMEEGDAIYAKAIGKTGSAGSGINRYFVSGLVEFGILTRDANRKYKFEK